MNTSTHKALYNIMVYCLRRHRDRVIPLFRCLDMERIRSYSSQDEVRNNDMENDWLTESFLLAVDTYATSILATIGILLNLVGFCQLMRRSERKKIFSLMLAVILLFDTIYLTFKLIRGIEIYIPVPEENLRLYYIIADSGARFAWTSSVLMMVAIGRVRHHAIQKPIRQRILLLSRKKRMQELCKHLIPAVMLSLAFTFPVIFEIDDVPIQRDDIYVQPPPSTVRLNPYYSFFIQGVLNFGLLGVLPSGCLMYYAHRIIVVTNMRSLPNGQLTNGRRIVDENNKKISKSLVVIIITFVTLNSLRIITAIGELIVLTIPNKDDFTLTLGYGVPIWLQLVSPISELCIVLNASANIIIYNIINSSTMTNYFHTIKSRYFGWITSTATPMPLTIAVTRPTELNIPSIEIPPSTPILVLPGTDIQTIDHENSSQSDTAVELDIVNQTCSFQIIRQGSKYI